MRNFDLHPSAQVNWPYVTIGRNCRIGPGVMIGFDGFGYEQDPYGLGTWVPKRHDCGVIIRDNVDIAANTCIDRGSWRDTVIGSGCKIDNLVHIAHNVVLEENCLVIAQAMLAGSVYVGRGAWIGPGARVNQRITIGERAFIGTGAVVTKNCKPNTVYAGVPAREIRPREERDK